MTYTYSIELVILIALGFVPNKKNPRYHKASCSICGYTVYCKDFRAAQKIANRVVHSLYTRGYNPRYRVEDVEGNYQYNW